jgi:hypothetical protein
MNLIDKIRLSRQSKVVVDKYEFLITRPTDMDMVMLAGRDNEYVLKKFVIGWNLKEIDIIPGGSAIDIAFDPELFYEWVADHSELWNDILEAILDAYKKHRGSLDDLEKKPEPG